MKYRFVTEFANFQIKCVKHNELINPGIKSEIIRRIERICYHFKCGSITVNETMTALSKMGMEPNEDMSKYMNQTIAE